ncbi:Fibronectin-binding protein A N-terminus (FbpA) [Babesia microti strain RI]|uniref:Ribosome quality control complex subunit 2 n=1 Tax=Babesia microti (strain RI) TaxID=1133968 RepID=A0A1N6LWT1_BABMR|nr:Fibronectin-binding protein A N-terminus (FbpA) [Babesia microti strain RI]SIO73327.1 Fibronectin-binding protein A N-terminus (FbpA) [Babesia microti strain RI]|eukprot:XP_021337429.1 Fibronectin-binding protein A N-terminus (FbpA) [Babesia microti strain RI]
MRVMTSLDICAVLKEIKEAIVGGSVINLYDVSKKVYILKVSNRDSKFFLLLEAGSRIHLTQFMRSKDSMPSGFTMKLRKHLKGKRVSKVRQLGLDRVVDIVFGTGDYEHHLIIQFYVSGNIFLTDNEYKILTSLRQHVPELKQSNSNIYPIPAVSNELPINPDLCGISVDNVKKFLKVGNYMITEMKRIMPYLNTSNIKQFIVHNEQISEDNIDQCAERLVCAILKISELLETLKKGNNGGYVTLDPKYVNSSLDCIPATALIDYSPIIAEIDTRNCVSFNSYNECLDFYFGKFETFEKPTKKPSKAEKIKIDQEKRISNMKTQVQIAEKNAYLIDKHSALVDECISLMRTLIATGSRWDDIWDEIELQKQMGHEIAILFDRVDFKTGEIFLSLKENSDDEDVCIVPVSVNQSVFSNLRGIHNMRKNILAKIDRTGLSMAMAIKNVQKNDKTPNKSDKSSTKQVERIKVKKRYWFEKFKWFISSDDYLVLAGRDSIQNEILVKRHMESNDIYIHADIHGAASCIVKNNSSDPIPQRTLIEAGQFSVCNSSAWKAKFMTSAWWVESSQVSKTPETGEYLPSGSFVIRGKKNFLPPSKLEMGLAVIYLNQYLDQDGANETSIGYCTGIVHNDVITRENDVLPNNIDGVQNITNDIKEGIAYQAEVVEINANDKSQKGASFTVQRIAKASNIVGKKKSDGKLVRGQKSKKKRMKKYEDQDSDIEEIRMMLMGSSKPIKHKSQPDEQIVEKKQSVREDIIRIEKPFYRPPPFTTALISKVSYTDQSTDASFEEANLTIPASTDSHRTNDETACGEIGTAKTDDRADNVPFQCVVMCGPWEAICRYRLRIKLLPGNGKKGQIASEALNSFKKSEVDEYRRGLLGQMKMDELSLAILGNCKVDKRCNG